MKQLATEIKHKGFLYIQEYRNDSYAIYSQWLDNKIIAFELIRIKKNKDRELFGKLYPASETYPDTKGWGKEGWTFKSYNNAIQRLTEYTTGRQEFTNTYERRRHDLTEYV